MLNLLLVMMYYYTGSVQNVQLAECCIPSVHCMLLKNFCFAFFILANNDWEELHYGVH